jgi:hypothetical protein
MLTKTYRNGFTDLVRVTSLRALATRRPVPQADLPDWIRRDIGLAEGLETSLNGGRHGAT